VFALCPLLALSSSSGAQTRAETPPAVAYVRDVVDPDLGLPDTQVSAIAQTPDGYLWLGTRRGLVRFDGLGATIYSPQNTPALRSWAINALSTDAAGSLWISTDRGLTVYERGVFRYVDPGQVPATTVWKVLRDSKNRVWVAGSFGVRVGDGTRFATVPQFDEYIYSIAEDRQHRLWFGGRRVLASYVEGDSTPLRWAPANSERVYDLAVDSANALWIALREGVRQLDISDRARIVERTRVSTAIGEMRGQVWSITIGANGALWMGTDTRGVLRWDGRTLQEVDQNGRRPADPVWWVITDSRGNVWAGTSGGLVRYRRSAFRTITAGLTVFGTWAVRGARDGTPWLSSDDGQVAWFDGTRWRPVFRGPLNRSAPALWPLASGGMLVADSEGRLWRATRNALTDVTKSVGLPAVDAYGLFEDRDGTIYNNTEHGLLRVREGGVDSVFRHLGLTANDQPRVIMRDRRGALVVGGPYLTIGEGTSRKRYGPTEGLTDSNVMAVHEAGGALWIATADSGLFALRGERVVSFAAANFRLNRGINGIIDDGDGSLWLTSRTGLMRVALAELLASADGTVRGVAVRQFDRADGLPTTDFNADFQSQLHRDARGRIWLPTYAGPVLFDPSAVKEDTVPPQVHVEAVAIDGTVQPRRDSVWAKEHPGRIEVHFAATNALVPRRVRAEYRVVGIGDQWIDAGARRTLTFGPLVGGDYRLEIRVAGEDGNWQPALAVLHIAVPRSLAEQSWFFPLVALTMALAAFGFTRWRLANARARERELSLLVSQRTADLETSRAELEVRVAERTEALSRELAERYRLEQRLESARRMASLGRLAGGVSHEINNALATVLGFAQLAQLASKHDRRVHADLAEVVRAGRRAASITHQLLAFARQHHTALASVQLEDVVQENLRSLQQLCAPLTLDFTGAPDTPAVNADAGQVEQLLVNLVKNARDAKPQDGRIVLSLELGMLDTARAVGDRVLPAGRYAVLSVQDRGTGISAETITHLFEPFFTTKEVNEGSGLGLAVVQGIVARHDGAIEVLSSVGEGTTFRVWFPEQSVSSHVDTAERQAGGSGETILLAEDDASIRHFATRMLREHGYRVLDAEDGAAAIALVGKSIESIDLLLTDVLMPNANGLELARLLRAARPELPVIFMTGYAGLDDAALAELRATGPVLAKPFTQETLLRAVDRALDGRLSPSAVSSVPS
jgi:signal transduction histidine kinase/ligand-binding sensor domain-containing protein/CheY-like chemotaxis protein